MMKNTFLLKWTAANALGLGVAFVVYLQIPMLAKYGLDFEAYWQWQEQAVEHGLVSYAGMLLALLVAGAILGASQGPGPSLPRLAGLFLDTRDQPGIRPSRGRVLATHGG